MGQNTFTSFPAGEYTGQLDTVYYRSSVSITGVAGTWLLFTLDNPYNYDSTKSLIIDISHCSFTGTGFTIWQSAGTTGIFRRNNLPGSSTCIFNYSSQDTRIIQSGVDIDQMIGITHQNNNIPSEYSLEQNYPNPFNPVTNFRFRIPEQGFVSLIIYDNLGREAGTVIKSELTPGIYDFEWDASGLSSGVYYYTLTAGKFSATKKLVLIK